MALSENTAKHALNKELYNALMEGKGEEVIQLCMGIPEGPFRILTIQNATVLHRATFYKQKDLVLKLLEGLPPNHFENLKHQNEIGHTVLHDAACSNRMVPAAAEMLAKAPELLNMRNLLGETALFRSARYGKKWMFEFLDGQVQKRVKTEKNLQLDDFYIRNDNTSMLHIAILTENLDLAYLIATEHEYLIGKRDDDGMTALQLLACNSSAFRIGNKQNSLSRLIYSFETNCRVPLWEQIQEQKQIYGSAVKLANFLIERDTSWQETKPALDLAKPKAHKYGQTSAADGQEVSKARIPLTPLLLATKNGIQEIVEKILEMYPQAVEHIDERGRNILHLAIKFREMEVFDFVERMGVPMKWLVTKLDVDGNTILHTAAIGMKVQEPGKEDMRSPAQRLQENLLLFERVKKISKTFYLNHLNADQKTAEMLFAENNLELRKEAKEWIKRAAENCIIVAVLIATVAFAAAYTIPGGPNQSTGYPILVNQPFFIVFTIMDVLSVALALTSVISFLSILTSPFALDDFKRSLPQKLLLGITLLILSVSMMMLAFGATITLMVRNGERWTRIGISCAALFPATIFAVAYLPLNASLMRTLMHSLNQVGMGIPRFQSSPSLIMRVKSKAKSFINASQPCSSVNSGRPVV